MPPARPLLALALVAALGCAWGTASGFHLAQTCLMLPLLAFGRTRWVGLVVCVCLVRCSPPPIEGDALRWRGRAELDTEWSAGRGHLAPHRLPRGLVGDGAWISLEGEPHALLEARGPGAPLSVVRRRYGVDQVRRLGGGDEGRLGPSWRERALQRLGHLADPETRALAQALLFADRRGLGAELVEPFTRTGTRHLLALSGLHVGLVAWIVATPIACVLAGLARRLLPNRWTPPAALLRALFVLTLIPLTGGGAPVVRAALAFSLASLAARTRGSSGVRGAGRRADGLSLWALALLIELALEPTAIRAVSVQLSYGATGGLLLWTGPLSRLWATAPAPVVPAGVSRWVAVPTRRAARALRSGVLASVVATLATLPLVWHHFGEVAPLGILLTPLALVALVPILALGWAWLAWPAEALELGLEVAVEGLLQLVRLGDLLPGTPVVLPTRPWPLLALGALLLLVALTTADARVGRRRLRAATLVCGALLVPWTPSAARLEVVLCDVGHGTAVLVRAPGLGTWLYDAGSRDRVGVARAAVAPILRRWETGRLDVVVSHLHLDHAGEVPWILARWQGGRRGGEPLDKPATHDIERGRLVLARSPLGSVHLLRGLDVPGNEGSRHLAIAMGDRRVLLLGDAEQAGLANALDLGLFQGPVDLLLLPHHGSTTPHLSALLEATRPALVWVSVGDRPPTGEELDRRGLAWVCTAEDGPQLAMYGFRRPSATGEESRSRAAVDD